MPVSQNFNAFLGAAVLGVISAAGMYLVEHYRQERRRYAMAKDLARLDQELSIVKRELQDLMAKKKDRPPKPSRKSKISKAHSIISTTTTDDYLSASNLDSSDLEFYDVSDDEVDSGAAYNLDAQLAEIDRKLDEGSVQDLNALLIRLQDLCLELPENPNLLWRIGKLHQKLSEKSDDRVYVKDQLDKGAAACAKALELDPNCSTAHKWMAILVGTVGDYQPIKEKIEGGHRFKHHLDKAIALDPKDPTLHHLLGRFCYEIAGFRWYERKIAAALFSEPPSATYADALEHFMECEKLADFEWKENKLMVAKCLVATGQYKEALQWLDKAKNCKQGDCPDDKTDTEINTLLAKYNSYR